MAKITQAQMYENRLEAINYLENPKLRKATGQLRDNKGGRCCLGHMCEAFPDKIQKEKIEGEWYYGAEMEEAVAPEMLIKMLGLHSAKGHSQSGYLRDVNGKKIDDEAYSLAHLNDYVKISPQSIGKYLRSVILGGKDTPWIKIRKPKGI